MLVLAALASWYMGYTAKADPFMLCNVFRALESTWSQLADRSKSLNADDVRAAPGGADRGISPFPSLTLALSIDVYALPVYHSSSVNVRLTASNHFSTSYFLPTLGHPLDFSILHRFLCSPTDLHRIPPRRSPRLDVDFDWIAERCGL